MDFILGCNYWASNAGADTWRDFNLEVIKKDLDTLSSHGISYLRIFPNWRDFQPIIPLYSGRSILIKYLMEGDKEPENPYYLSNDALDKFSLFLDECEKRNISVIVSLLTGWMSGRLFIPTALYDKNLLTDSTALYFEQLFIKGFVSKFKNRKVICAWNLGNECGVMGEVKNTFEANSWLASISNAIRAEDSNRPVISGIHHLTLDGPWRICDQPIYTDILTPHPYPYWGKHTRIDKTMSYRTSLYATAISKYYQDISKAPCLVDEIGTMGPSVCSENLASDYARINALSLLANGVLGMMWWCAFDQDKLNNYPYQREMVERELGMLDSSHNAKPVLKEFEKIKKIISEIDNLPKPDSQAVCLLSQEQDHWGVAYSTYCLLKKVNVNCTFAWCDNPIPDSKLYLLPSICNAHVIEKRQLENLLNKVKDGATLYVSADNGLLSKFEEITGLEIIDSYDYQQDGFLDFNGKKIPFSKRTNLLVKPKTAKVLAVDQDNNPTLTVNKYGEGQIIYLAFPLESSLINKKDAFDDNSTTIYKELFNNFSTNKLISFADKNITYTVHSSNDKTVIFALNHSQEKVNAKFDLCTDYKLEKIIYGNNDYIPAWDGLIFSIVKK